MRVPLSWLKEYVTWDLPIDRLAERLTLGGLEVAAIDRVGEEWDPTRITVGQVISVRKHPNADRLVLVTVDYGRGEPMEVVTGAVNLRVGDSGQKVVFATVGARLIDPYADTLEYKTMKRGEIRGIPSAGMACSEKELGISDDHTGIMILPDDAPVGTPFAEYWGDVVLDLDLTLNVARCFAITGVAREVAALVGGDLSLSAPAVITEGDPIDGQIEIEIEDPDLCPRYSGALITGVKIGPSPHWMQRRLALAGMRPINNIVDITNYVMLELGQPLHAFDYRLLRPRTPGGTPTIIVRRAHYGEEMTTLDEVERALTSDMLLITDGGRPVAVAGVMGGLESEVAADTVDVLLEAASFDNISIRLTSRALKIPSEAAQRFARGVDPELTLVALRRAADLMRELAGGAVARGFADAYPRPPESKVIDFKVSEVKRLLGIELPPQEVARVLESLGFACEVIDAEPPIVRTTVPSFRLDVAIPADLVEEVARIYGYDRLPATLIIDEMPGHQRDIALELEEQVRDILVGCGLTETITYSLTNLESVAKLIPEPKMPDPETYVRIANPLSHEQEYMRQSLMSTTLETAARNLRFLDRVAVFEIAHVYLPKEGHPLPDEPRRLSIALSGSRATRSWLDNDGDQMDLYDLKGILETLLARLGLEDIGFVPARHPTFRQGSAGSVKIGEVEIGVFGEVHPTVRANYDLPEQRVCLLELDLDKVLAAARPTPQFKAISRMPALKLDLALVVDETVPTDLVGASIRRAGGSLLVDSVLFDVYRGEQISPDKKSLAYSLTFQAEDRTLTTKQATSQRDRIVKLLEREYGAQIRA